VNRQIILVKHSLPEINNDLPAREWKLSGEGRARAERLADSLKPHRLDSLVASKEPKAMETARIVAAKCGVDLHEVEGLHEHERWTTPYLSKQEFEAVVYEFFEKPDMLVFGNETANQAYERFSRAINSILSESDNSKIGIVAHGTVISLYVSRLTGQSGFQLWSQLGLPGFVVLDLQLNKLIALENIS
jgi:broad specificity phosphatase PhoE